jgi:hypothetical protein
VLWQFAVQVAAYTRNLAPSVDVEHTPCELFYGSKPAVRHLRIFGCDARVLIPDEKRGTFDAVREPGLLVGYAEFSLDMLSFQRRTVFLLTRHRV